jgi:GDPmannose 4,6-dehydratase
MAKTALITGASGQDGAYLSQFLLKRGYRVLGQVRPDAARSDARLRELGIAQHVQLVKLDLFDVEAVRRAIDQYCPDEVYNLAGPSSVARSFEQPAEAIQVNALAAARLIEALRLTGRGVRFFQASTSEMFGSTTGAPQNEATPFRPRSPYAVAKLFAHWQTISYREAYSLFGTCGIMFNHESPLRQRRFVTRKVTAELAEVKHGRRERVLLGNLDVQRDWGFAHDFVEGMWLMLQQREPQDFVLATGRLTSVRRFVERAAETLSMRLRWSGEGISEVGIDEKSGGVIVAVDAALFRPAELTTTLGDAAHARATLSWRPSVDIEGLVAMMAEADERRLLENRPLD